MKKEYLFPYIVDCWFLLGFLFPVFIFSLLGTFLQLYFKIYSGGYYFLMLAAVIVYGLLVHFPIVSYINQQRAKEKELIWAKKFLKNYEYFFQLIESSKTKANEVEFKMHLSKHFSDLFREYEELRLSESYETTRIYVLARFILFKERLSIDKAKADAIVDTTKLFEHYDFACRIFGVVNIIISPKNMNHSLLKFEYKT